MNQNRRAVLHFPIALPLRAALLGLGLLAGCAGPNCDLVEAELRSREREVAALREELHHAECLNAALQRECHDLHPGAPVPGVPAPSPVPVPSGSAKPLPEQISPAYRLKEVKLGRGTGGYDDDGCPGDEALQVVLEPFDCDNHAVKAPGALHVTALEVTTEGLKKPLSTWDVPPDKLRRSWRSGILGTGYHVILPWQVLPSTCKLRVVAQFTLADGRAFEADKDITVRLPPGPHPPGPAGSPAGDPPPPSPPNGDSPLFPPRKLDGGPLLPDAQARAGRVNATSAKPAWLAAPSGPAAELQRPVAARAPY